MDTKYNPNDKSNTDVCNSDATNEINVKLAKHKEDHNADNCQEDNSSEEKNDKIDKIVQKLLRSVNQ